MKKISVIDRRRLADRVTGFVRFAEAHLERGNLGAVAETLGDIERAVDDHAAVELDEDPDHDFS